jgi:flagellar protein FliO/FliZ
VIVVTGHIDKNFAKRKQAVALFFGLLAFVSAHANQAAVDVQIKPEEEEQLVLTARPDDSLDVKAVESAAKNLAERSEVYSGKIEGKNSIEADGNAPLSAADLKLLEANTPVSIQKTQKSKSGLHPMIRLVLSFLVVGLLLSGLVLFSKWYQRRIKKNDGNTTIRVLTQHHLGPRKSLAIVRVAGESILLGVTDHNISMIKSLSLIDDEFADVKNEPNFSTALAKTEKNVEMKPEEEFVLSTIKDRLSTTLRGMRPF